MIELVIAIGIVCASALYAQHAHYKRTIKNDAPAIDHSKAISDLSAQLKELKSAITILQMKDGFKR